MLLNEIDKNKTIHMIGIGGSSMSGIAEIVLNMGYKVSGSDMSLSETTKRLEESGIKIFEGHHSENVESAGLVVYTAAISKENPELIRAHELGIPTLERSEFLGEITKLYSKTISVCGTHGKTTTSSMLSLVFNDAKKDPTVQVGANIKQLNNLNYRIGNSPYFILESCEYVRSFLQFHPQTVVLLNIEEDHLDYYKDLEDIKSAFRDFVLLVPHDGFVILNADDKNCVDVCKSLECNVVTFGIKNKNADFYADNIVANDDGCFSFDVHSKKGIYRTNLKVLGYHNIYNSLSVIAAASCHEINEDLSISSLETYSGVSRRFDYVGTYNDVRIYDDYAHHPTEIKATIASALKIKHERLWIVFQPHTYTRTHSLFNEFATAFDGVDNLILIDIYAARETDTGLVSSKQLAEKINEHSNNCKYIPTLEEAKVYLQENLSSNDILLTVGAGTITKLGRMILDK